jgi:NADPH:quinone reductase-like Zn-dependent oxidoreductase
MKRSPNAPPLPLIIYGASSSLGCYAIKLARASNIHPIIAICSKTSAAYVSSLLDEDAGDTIVDYRQGVDGMKADVKKALNGLTASHALDAISSKGTWVSVAQMLDPDGGYVSVVQGGSKYDEPEIPAGVQVGYTHVGTSHSGAFPPTAPRQPEDKESVKADPEFAYVLVRYVARMLGTGEFRGHPVEVVPGGLGGVETGLRKLQHGGAKGVKLVYRIGETGRV